MFKQIAQHHSGGCMMLIRRADDDSVEFVGSAFLCHTQGYLLSCAHTIHLTDRLAVLPPMPINAFNPITLKRVNPFEVSVAQFDPKNDVALLRLTRPPTLTVPDGLFGDENSVRVGATVCYLGFPFGQSGLHTIKVSQSIISSKVISTSDTRQFQLDAMVHEGNSGGPLIELASGKIIGVISGRFSPTGSGGGLRIGNHPLGTESTISYATTISYGIELLKSEGLHG